MKILLFLLPLSLLADLYECKDSFLIVESSRIIETSGSDETFFTRKSYDAYCYDYFDAGKDRYICIEQKGSTFTWIAARDHNWSEKCTRLE